MPHPKQIKRKLSETSNAEPPRYADIVSPSWNSGSQQEPRDEDLVSAAEALTRLTNSATPPPSFHETHCTLALQTASPSSSTPVTEAGTQIHPIVKRVNTISKLPLVTNAVKYYETSKKNYATFNYAAGIVEKAAMPVFSKIEVNLNNKHQAKLEERARIKKKRRINKKHEKHEIKKRIKFCLHILKLANENISSKVVDLQEKMKETEALKTVKSESPTPVCQLTNESQTPGLSPEELTPISTNSPEKALETNNEIVATVKKIVHVISNFRPSSLNVGDDTNGGPNDDVKLKKTIREIILSLPKQVSQTVPGAQKAPHQAISFARESLDMIGRLTTVFNEQLEKAEHWVDRSTDDMSIDSLVSESPAPSELTKIDRPGVVRLKSEESFHSLYSQNDSA
ncbi:hypothetical protein METBIDRAFT_80183 [Metschnikowia bicuspidata var. bicuspidata NRRL YB-4993]|uniref:Uncharacterized protein n=1 Tax=Metschnikowia bicuspidata var. bicuspidata NRRL YB-4993 TaxID=869754 RepID=A0A1A0GZ35_9ASCO|nr:hypothetical protein METBIDRAFT_80183 [Metschnikowia bicuspidata var. bicuspidata NRRL YB-4993]OBA17016.1 hypothetical protein METBIDRAFT_80183 [Metschnikowia bicuspidata var. bicuspidata NRRL YB-4993]